MTIGNLQVELFLSEPQSLKEKRMVLKSLKTRLRNNFNIAVSELDYHEKWQKTLLGIVSINNKRRDLDAMFSHIINFIEKEERVEIVDYSIELL